MTDTPTMAEISEAEELTEEQASLQAAFFDTYLPASEMSERYVESVTEIDPEKPSIEITLSVPQMAHLLMLTSESAVRAREELEGLATVALTDEILDDVISASLRQEETLNLSLALTAVVAGQVPPDQQALVKQVVEDYFGKPAEDA